VSCGCRQFAIRELMMRVFVAGATGAIGESKRAMLSELGAVPVVADAWRPTHPSWRQGSQRDDRS
jgi:hypothetical protein